ncbi:MAG: AMP-binding protein, partial [Deltaproteobacteria bacterium]|nr:AMP-binding protein [Deltaproteobacteria bacterium]
ADGAVGRTVISTGDPGLFLEYYGDPEGSEAARRNGVYDTGDLAYRDADGYFFIAGRSDDCFKTRGLFLVPTEVENALQRHPAVAEAVVVPEPDPEIGNRVLGVVVPAEGQGASAELAETLRQSLRDELAHYKVPYRIAFAEAIPKSPVGKILRNEVAARSRR